MVPGPVCIRLCLALFGTSLVPAPAGAAPARPGVLTWPTPSRPTLAPCAKAEERPKTGRGFLIAGGIIAGLGLIPLSTGIYTRVKYGPCGDGGGFICLDGTGQLAAGGVLVALGAIFLTVGGVRRHRFREARAAAQLQPHLARTAHGGAVAGLQLRF
jgi:hypothetical protein